MLRIFSLREPTTREKEFAIRSGARRESLETDPPTPGGKLDPGTGGARCGNAPGLGGLKSLVALMPQNIFRLKR